jgi:hypothetical protein
MTRHSTLTNPNDLHYAKIRVFTGNPNVITPDFENQLLTATDTNKVYRATGTSEGALVELSSSEDGGVGASNVRFHAGIAIAPNSTSQLLIDTDTNRVYRATGLEIGDWLELIGGNDGLPSTISIGGGSPSVAPVEIGQLYFDFVSRMQWVSVRSGSLNGWVELCPIPQKLFASLANNSSQTVSQYVNIFYADVTDPSEIESADYTFTNYLGAVFISGQTFISDLAFPQGRGAFVIVPKDVDPNAIAIDAEEWYVGSNLYSSFEVRESPYNLFTNDGGDDIPAGKKYLWIPSYWWDSISGFVGEILFEVRITVSDAP